MIGQTLGHYRIDSQLGAGAMGVVYRAHDTQLQRAVAIKLVGESFSKEPTARERLLREARTASALNHPHVCTIHEVGEAEGQVYIVMEFVEGRPLSERLQQSQPAESVVRYGIQIADALAHAHERGIVHRDLKTGNVMVTPEGRAKVLDFGLAKRLPTEGWEQGTTQYSSELTEAGKVVGTLHYMSPEVLRGHPADARSDIWALGVLLYELATGRLPFQGQTRFELTHAILGEAAGAMPAGVPVGLRGVIQRCLSKEPGQRYQRAGEVRAALEAIQSGSAEALAGPALRRFPKWAAWLVTGTLALVAAVAALRGLGNRERGIQSIAVLPFANLGGNPDNEYLSDGITESVIGSLSHLPNLKMIAFGSVLRYKGRPVDTAAVARDLGVGAVVVGRVRQRGDHLSISAELIDTRDGSRLWGDQYDESSSALLAVQQQIATRISDQLRSHLTGEEKSRVTKRYTENAEAYDLYLRGHYYWQKFTPEGYEKSLEFYRKAIDADPGYAPAYAGTAYAYIAMTWEGYLAPKQGYEQVEAAALKAQKLDDTLAEAYSPLAQLKYIRDWDWPAAEKVFLHGLTLDPQNPYTHRFYSQFLRAMGRWDEAFAQIKQAQELDPLGVETNKGLGATYYWAGRYDQAIEQYRKILEIDPNHASTHEFLADVYARKGMYKEAIAETQQVFLLNGYKDDAEGLGEDFKTVGYQAVMRQLDQGTLEGLKEAAKKDYVSPVTFALSYVKLGDKDQAFAWLERAAAEKNPWVTFIKTDPAFESLRSDPRFAALVRRIGLTP